MANLRVPTHEIWKDIPGYENKYQASNLGRIKSLISGGRLLKPFPNRDGYLLVDLRDKTISVHRIIAMTFIGNPPSTSYACMHLNNKKDDNRLVNLKWGTYSENAISAIKDGLYIHGRTGKHGSENPQSKKVAQLDLDGRLIAKFDSIVSAAKTIGGRQGAISNVCSGRSKTSRGFVWKFI